ncbi:AdoMet-dependent methyltransferase predicted [Macrophomina phaseolina MS6]|uniref:tRNA (uracil-O(2)-)-methyltransferase n=1 Tax=Macrophomina phaseolina (strain MS6) TaxID=1126212 RepID=K2QVL2_MACPH|nr:AdoMet-dependent methyltransferase predicted [Macrophomina phaseolina MS6]
MGSPEEAQIDATGQRKVFEPRDLSQQHPTFTLPGEIWTSMVETPCSFEPEYYQRVMLNLIRHPEIASTYLFRAEIFYDSFNDPEGKFVKHIKAEYKPRACEVAGYVLQQTIVRRMIPRNPQRDDPLVQTCHIFNSKEPSGPEKSLVIYIPHAESPTDVPFYHPTVSALAFLHTWPTTTTTTTASATLGTLSIHYRLFPTHALDTRLMRTALSLLTLINKHSLGQKAGYVKRVHHDQLIPQARFQDTYTRLKSTYAKPLIDAWVEQTPPGKHVFEDLGIAAFLLELWADMYATNTEAQNAESKGNGERKPPFPGFVDIGCGNGVLVYVLRQEGFPGWGFDARRRKTWDTFPPAVQESLKELVLVPESFQRSAAPSSSSSSSGDAADVLAALGLETAAPKFHNGVFEHGTFIVSNHADELTPWTPLLAYLSGSPFIAIPCCSHNFAGAKFRAPVQKAGRSAEKREAEKQQEAKTGDLKKKNHQPSAYATLCDWVERLAEDVGFVPEKEMLRIPSTRNAGIVGRRRAEVREEGTMEERLEVVRRLLVEQMGGNVDGVGGLEGVGREWVERAGKLVKGVGGGH